jgi:predicted SAM-dependent methyltransferase
MKLNIGCGNDKRKGYTNIDIRQDVDPDAICDIRYLEPIPDESCDEILANHVLEHFPHWQTTMIMKTWVSKLRPGGVLDISVPDMEGIAKNILSGENHRTCIHHIYGGQDYSFNYHCNGFTEKTLSGLMKNFNLEVIKVHRENVNLHVVGRKK